MNSRADRNLLFGILALQLDFITREQLIAGMHAWVLAKEKSLADILQQNGSLAVEDRATLETVVDRHLQKHNNDVQQSLAAVSSIGSVKEELSLIADPQLDASLPIISTARKDDPYQTISAGESTSSGTRFRILRPHAEGGLGKVFVARDAELNREVALKEIQPQHAHNQSARARFVLEAEITGGLQHPNIVPVYGLGNYPDGRPFYAMRFIQGDSLKEAIAEFHDPEHVKKQSASDRAVELRHLLGRFIDVCHAVDYAHDRGVLHRDLKPGNIMLGKHGETLVVDWGLAKARGKASDETLSLEKEAELVPESGSSVEATRMGSVLGTLKYMAPEQAAGRLDLLGNATDVFALGAILYELLAGQGPYQQKTKDELMAAVQKADFPSPRDLQPTIPRPLEAICLKAMQREPLERFASVKEMRQDLERWLADEPISCLRESALFKLQRWTRRHAALAAGSAATFLVGVVSLTLLLTIFVWSNNQLEKANKELTRVNSDLDNANGRLNEANIKLAAAVEVARSQNQLALETINYVVNEVDGSLENVAGAGEVRRRLLNGVLERMKTVSDQYQSRAAIDLQTFVSLITLTELTERIGLAQGAPGAGATIYSKDLLERAHVIAKALVEAEPTNQRAQRALSISYSKLGGNALRSGDLEAGRQAFLDSHAILERIVKTQPTSAEAQSDLSISYDRLGEVALQMGDLDGARNACSKGLEIRQQQAEADLTNADAQRALSISYDTLGDILLRLGQAEEARQAYTRSLKIRQQQAESDPANFQALRFLSASYNSLAKLAWQTGDLGETRKANQEALKITQRLAEADPANIETQRDLSICHMGMGNLAEATGDLKGARQAFEQSLQIRQRLAEADPTNAEFQKDVSDCHGSLGDIALKLGDFDLARQAYRVSVDIVQRMADANPTSAELQRKLWFGLTRLGALALKLENLDEAMQAYKESLRIIQRLAEGDPTDAVVQKDLAFSHSKIGDTALQEGDLEGARKAYEMSLNISQRLAEADPKNAEAQRDLLYSYRSLAEFRLQSGDIEAARRAYRASLKINKQLVEDDPMNFQGQRDLYFDHNKLGNIALLMGDLERAAQEYREYLKISQRLAEANPTNPQAQWDLAIGHFKLGMVASEEESYDSAILAFEASIRVLEQYRKQSGMDVFQTELADFKSQIERCERELKKERPKK